MGTDGQDMDGYFTDVAERDWQTTDEGTVRLALVGLGRFTRSEVLPAVRNADLCEVTALVSGSPETASAVAREYGVDVTLDYDAFEDGERSDAFDAVYVGGPNGLHLDYTRTAARLGKHVVCEKPMEVSADRAREMVELCDDAGVTLVVAYRPQVEPTMRRVRELVRDGAVGDPVQIHAWFTGHILDQNADADQWRLDPDLAGGGALMDVGVYPLNASRFLLDADPVAVQATTHAPDAAFEGVDEHVAFLLTFPGGATASCTASYDAQQDDRLRLVGTEGQVQVNPAFDAGVTPTVTLERGEETVEYTGPFVNETTEEFDYFAHCVLTGTEPEPDGRDGLADVEVVEAVYESAETGRRVDL
ncbi:D-xylose 1-dehydrogenase Gfo6 [Halomicrococcus sp. NG-SE-24]|uniref:D-xylose 1-dehydrogenase Gfo6 n=1 Tax=Halomicrococcus sp. NG-SE-24 TaxID=3436928 RepID=UPI003D99A7AE